MTDAVKVCPTEREVIDAVYKADNAEVSDITRFSEMIDGKWHARTIFDGDAALIRFARLIAAPAAAPDDGLTDLLTRLRAMEQGLLAQAQSADGGEQYMAEVAHRAADALTAAHARAEQDKADAERYRWLRELANMDYPVRHGAPGVSVNMPTGNNACHYPVQSDLDAAIDRARSQEPK